MDETILTRNPARGNRGVRISRAKYAQVRAAIIATLQRRKELTFGELGQAVAQALTKARIDGSPMWYYTCVKLDMEARKEQVVSRSGEQRVRLAEMASIKTEFAPRR